MRTHARTCLNAYPRSYHTPVTTPPDAAFVVLRKAPGPGRNPEMSTTRHGHGLYRTLIHDTPSYRFEDLREPHPSTNQAPPKLNQQTLARNHTISFSPPLTAFPPPCPRKRALAKRVLTPGQARMYTRIVSFSGSRSSAPPYCHNSVTMAKKKTRCQHRYGLWRVTTFSAACVAASRLAPTQISAIDHIAPRIAQPFRATLAYRRIRASTRGAVRNRVGKRAADGRPRLIASSTRHAP